MGCQHWILYNRITHESTLFACNSARCTRQECRECWAKKRIAIAQNLINKYHLTRFFTLTIDRRYSAEISWQNISAWWHRFRQRMRRLAIDYGIELKFFAILEQHNDGYPHVHGFWNLAIDQDDLSRIWSECAPGHIVDIRTVDDGDSAADYLGIEVGRYIGKKQAINAANTVKKHKRTMWRSQGLKTDYELRKKAIDNECDPDYNRVWVLDKAPVPVVLENMEVEHGNETERTGQHMERTCEAIPEEGSIGSEPKMDSAEGQGEAMPGLRHLCRQTEQPECRDKEASGSRGEDTKTEVVYGYEKTRNEVYTERAKSGEFSFPDSTYSCAWCGSGFCGGCGGKRKRGTRSRSSIRG